MNPTVDYIITKLKECVESAFVVRSLTEIHTGVSTNIKAAFFRSMTVKFIRSHHTDLVIDLVRRQMCLLEV
jgi:hypothetical protein